MGYGAAHMVRAGTPGAPWVGEYIFLSANDEPKSNREPT